MGIGIPARPGFYIDHAGDELHGTSATSGTKHMQKCPCTLNFPSTPLDNAPKTLAVCVNVEPCRSLAPNGHSVNGTKGQVPGVRQMLTEVPHPIHAMQRYYGANQLLRRPACFACLRT